MTAFFLVWQHADLRVVLGFLRFWAWSFVVNRVGEEQDLTVLWEIILLGVPVIVEVRVKD
jgi:hypothetical protein